jgi:hypothetical protein
MFAPHEIPFVSLVTHGSDVHRWATAVNVKLLLPPRQSRGNSLVISTIGIDLAKNVFQVHGVDAAEKLVLKKQLRRSQVLEFFSKLSPCLVGMEACATSHQWARELKKLGHDVRLMPANYVKAYVKRGKNDVALAREM